jgi:N-acyl-D-aspartate/D-glutamate deacylase
MLDVVIRGGFVVDGTGAVGTRADVGVRDGRVVAIGSVDEVARRSIDATDLVVAPGFVDIHTHYDAQVLWDPALTPSCLHGVTTVISGNCGFSLAPMLDDADADYLVRMLSRVEGMPIEALQAGVPRTWRTIPEYLEQVDRGTALNVGMLAGHSAIRRAVMGADAIGSTASEDQLAAMQQMLAEALTAGCLGFSSTWSVTHKDHNADPVPSRHADLSEMTALAAVVGDHAGAALEFDPGNRLPDDAVEAMLAMSSTARRILNWNAVVPDNDDDDAIERKMSTWDRSRVLGGEVVPLVLPHLGVIWMSFSNGFLLDLLPGWEHVMTLPRPMKRAVLADPASRAELARQARTITEGLLGRVAHWDDHVIGQTFSPATKRFEGMTVAEAARATGKEPFDALAEISVEDDLRTLFHTSPRGEEREHWARRVEVMRDPRSVIGGNDAGAHLDVLDAFTYPTKLLARVVREHELMTIEEMIHRLTLAPARLYGLVDRGRVAVGAHADLVILDPRTVGPLPTRMVDDLPSGAARMFAGAVGVERVLVAGQDVVVGAKVTGARPGSLLRSGRDTRTVSPDAPAGS